MTADGNDRGVKAPRTLFSLGRPGTKRPRDEAADSAVVDEAVTTTEAEDDVEIQYACGVCGALLPSGATICAECGTPVALDDDYDTDDMLDALVDFDDEPSAGGDNGAGAVLAGSAFAADTPVDDATLAEPVAEEPVAEEPVAEEPVAEQAPTRFDPNTTTRLVAPLDALADADAAEAAEAAAGVQGQEPAPVEPASMPEEPPSSAPSDEQTPAAVLYADPSIAEPLPPKAEGSWAVSEPMVGNAHADEAVLGEAEPIDDAVAANDAVVAQPVDASAAPSAVEPAADHDTAAPAFGAAVAGAAAGAVVGDEPAHADAAEAPTVAQPPVAPPGGGVPAPAWTVEPEPEPSAVTGLQGTTADHMPYGAGPVESSARSNKGVLIAAAVVIAVVLLGGVAFALTRGGGADVATQPSTTTVTTAKSNANKSSTTASSTASSTSTTAASTTSSEATTTTSADTSTTPSSAPSTTVRPTTQSTVGGPSPTVTTPAPSGPKPGAISFAGPTSFRIAKGGTASFSVSNSGAGPGQFQCSAGGGVQLSPDSGNLEPGQSMTITIQDFRGVGATYNLSCFGAGGGRYSATVVVD